MLSSKAFFLHQFGALGDELKKQVVDSKHHAEIAYIL
jgi:hypothetical protein